MNNLNRKSFTTNFLIKVPNIRLFLICITILTVVTGCSSHEEIMHKIKTNDYITKTELLLNTVVTINLYDKQDEDILEECFDIIRKYEAIYSRTMESSELYAVNQGIAPHTGLTYSISDQLADLIEYGLYYSELGQGAFDISIAPITSLWNFTSGITQLPDPITLQNALTYVNYRNIKLEGNLLTYAKKGTQLDLGAIAKGYIADRVKEYLISMDVHSAMINLGGNIVCLGEKPDGTPFHIGIQKPFADRNETLAVMDIRDRSVVTSGIYERFFVLDGITYHHIINPKTGYPYRNELISITIISNASVDGDGLSTLCFALGLEKGLELIKSLPDTYAIFITKDYETYYSEGFLDTILLHD
ncbi:FAD:protein FMN transferase [Lachnospiraceae bacterium MD1]|jgi:thiamine biosynthesis lipoprotein|uniref:FAD:protein FMN transferase n=1 Tax=Variimorphobacter saccharofermentans TaxID=2755051 RepID=A0A839K123_9FIRM|nr:FAD:protein FMN transferase [Variimorphobacter saccharofermentans]MBB2183128.1 FAD:protein FMN transferase [Variimorphobacter saccharofermentans]